MVVINIADFSALVRQAAGYAPYPYQQRLAEEGLPNLLRAPTGAGKTLAATLPWLYRRRFHPDPAVRTETPRWLVVVLPQRSLVEQTVGAATMWLHNLGLSSQVKAHVLMGGSSADDRAWKLRPGDDAMFVGTQDMVLSRLLLRGYAEPRAAWPVAFGLLHASTQFVFDEVQLMGPALPTSLQLEGLRRALGVPGPVRSMWMSATVDAAALRTPDYAGPDHILDIGQADRTGPLRRRLDATRRIERAQVASDAKRYPKDVAKLLLARHQPASRTIVVINTVERASAVYDAVESSRPEADLVLLHARFRPEDRARHTDRALAEPGPAGTIVVATQVLEAGVDVSSQVLITEVAPWSSVVQRAGRCNRAGEYEDATLVWLPVPSGKMASAPYEQADLDASAEALATFEGARVTSSNLQDRAVPEGRPIHPVLRRRDLLDLVDTAPDLSGNDLDVSQWIRTPDQVTAAVAWRDLGSQAPAEDALFPAREELCAVPVGQLRDLVKDKSRSAWLYDQTDGNWRRAHSSDVRAGAVIVLDAGQGGYRSERGWSPESKAPVAPVSLSGADVPDDLAADAMSVATKRWVPLGEHLDDVRREVEVVFNELGPLPGISTAQRAAAALAGLYHDLGKAHPVFVDTLKRSADGGGDPDPGPPWAKSGGNRRSRHSRPYFRHELAGALVLLDPANGLLEDVADPDLVAYLVAAHHGKARLTVRAMPGEQERGTILGIAPEDEPFLPFTFPDGRELSRLRPRLEVLSIGNGPGGDSWQARTARLRDRPDLGPFRLAFLEAVVRMADWRASARYDSLAAPAEAPVKDES